MALGIKFTDGSTTLYDCTGNGRYIDANNGWQRGQSTDQETVMDTWTMLLRDTIANIQAAASAISRILEQAAVYDEQQLGEQIFLEGTLDGSNWRRSPVVGGVVLGYDIDSAIRSGFAQIVFMVERKDYFDGPVTNVPLTNPNGTDVTTGLRIYNCNDGAVVDTSYHRHNYVEIDGANDVLGDLPASCKVRVVGESLNRIYMGLGWANVQSINLCMEDEFVIGSRVANSNCSGGYYCHDDEAWTDTITSGDESINWFLPVIRARITGTNVPMEYYTTYGQHKTVYLTQETYSATDWQLYPLPVIRAPAAGPNMMIQLIHLFTNGNHQDADFTQLLPVNFWRIGIRADDGAVANEFCDDGLSELHYFSGGASSRYPTYAYGPGIFLQPGKTQRLWVLRQIVKYGYSDSSSINMVADITITYRPRFRSL